MNECHIYLHSAATFTISWAGVQLWRINLLATTQNSLVTCYLTRITKETYYYKRNAVRKDYFLKGVVRYGLLDQYLFLFFFSLFICYLTTITKGLFDHNKQGII